MNYELNYPLTNAASKFWFAMNARDHCYSEGLMEETRENEQDALGAAAEMMHAINKIEYWPTVDGSEPF